MNLSIAPIDLRHYINCYRCWRDKTSEDDGSLNTPVGNAKGFDFSPDGKRFWVC